MRLEPAGPVRVLRTATPVQCFLKLWSPEIMTHLVQKTNDFWKQHKMPFKPLTVEELMLYFKTRMDIQVSKLPLMSDYWYIGGHPLGRNRFREIHNNMMFDRNWLVDYLNKQFQLHWNVGSEVTLDELLDPFTGETPYHCYMPRKPNKNGHLFYEVCSKSASTGKAYALSVLPWMSGKVPTTFEAVQFALDAVNKEDSMLVMDSWFLSKNSKQILDEASRPYLAAVNSGRWSHIWTYLKSKTKEEGSYFTLWNDETEVAVRTQLGEKRSNIMTNAYHPVTTEEPEEGAPFGEDYCSYFNSCDRFNRKLGEIRFPHRQPGWLMKFLSTFLEITQVNAWVIYNSIKSEKQQKSIVDFIDCVKNKL